MHFGLIFLLKLVVAGKHVLDLAKDVVVKVSVLLVQHCGVGVGDGA